MSTSTTIAPNITGAGHTIATMELRLNKLFSTSLEPSEATSVVYQTIAILSVDKDDVVRVRGTPYYFPNSNNDRVTLSPTKQVVRVSFGSTAVPSSHHSKKLSVKAHADVPGLGRRSKPVTDASSIPDGYKRGDKLDGDYESLRSEFWRGARITLGGEAQRWAEKGARKCLQMRKSANSHPGGNEE